MCGRYYLLGIGPKLVFEFIGQANRRDPEHPVKTGEVAPTDRAAVLANSRAGNRSAFAMRWGYRLDGGRLVINARSETAERSPLFGDGIARRRCLVPATHYFEWEHRGKEKIRYAIGENDDGLIYMAGVYRLEETGPAFAILTRKSADCISFIHDRMPVILPAPAAEEWLDLSRPAQPILEQALSNPAFRLSPA